MTLLRAAQEALTNVAAPRAASRVGLTLSYMEDLVTLDVRDDGVGFNPDRNGYGLTGMRQRVHRRRWRARRRVRARRGHRDLRQRPRRARMIISLLIVDDHPVVRNGLRGIFTGDPEFEVLGEAVRRPRGRRRSTLARRPQVVLMDLRMPGTDGVSAIRELARAVAGHARAGAHHLQRRQRRARRDRRRRHRLPAQGRAAGGAAARRPRRRPRRVRALPQRRRHAARPRPRAAARGAAVPARAGGPAADRRGATNREAAKQLFISEATVKTHLIHVYAKLGVNDRAAAVAAAYERGLLGQVLGRTPDCAAAGHTPYLRERPMSFSATGSLHL